MRRKFIRLLPLLLALIGIALIVYPYVSDWYYKDVMANEVASFDEEVAAQDDTTIDEEFARAQDYNKRLAESHVVVTDPFDPNANIISYDEYESLLNTQGGGMMATLYIPKINAALPIYHGTEDDVLESGVGHMSCTSLPVGGAGTHTVLAGHNGLPSKRIFDDLDKIEVGDYFIIRVLGEDHAYRVTSIETVLPNDTSSLMIQEDKDLCTLVTCVPYGINTHRLLVHAERCDVPPEWLESGSDDVISASKSSTRLPLAIVLVAGAFVILLLYLLSFRKPRRHKASSVRAGAYEPKHMTSGGERALSNGEHGAGTAPGEGDTGRETGSRGSKFGKGGRGRD